MAVSEHVYIYINDYVQTLACTPRTPSTSSQTSLVPFPPFMQEDTETIYMGSAIDFWSAGPTEVESVNSVYTQPQQQPQVHRHEFAETAAGYMGASKAERESVDSAQNQEVVQSEYLARPWLSRSDNNYLDEIRSPLEQVVFEAKRARVYRELEAQQKRLSDEIADQHCSVVIEAIYQAAQDRELEAERAQAYRALEAEQKRRSEERADQVCETVVDAITQAVENRNRGMEIAQKCKIHSPYVFAPEWESTDEEEEMYLSKGKELKRQKPLSRYSGMRRKEKVKGFGQALKGFGKGLLCMAQV